MLHVFELFKQDRWNRTLFILSIAALMFINIYVIMDELCDILYSLTEYNKFKP